MRALRPILLPTVLLALAVVPAYAADLALVGGTVHPVASAPIEAGVVLIEGERIAAVGGATTPVPSGAEIVDVSGLHVYPSLIAAETVLGLTEIGSVRGTVDIREVGRIHPQIRAEVAVNPDSELLPVARSNGLLVAGVAPRGGLVSGTSAVMMLEGWTWEDMTLKSPAALYVSWPTMRIRRGPDAKPPPKEQEKEREDRIDEIREAFRRARAWHKARAAMDRRGVPRHENDVRWEAMGPALRGEIPVVVRARRLAQIEAALDWASEEGLEIVISGGTDAWRVADRLAEEEIPVILDPVLAIPWRDHEPYDTVFRTASLLEEAGVPLCISTRSAANARNLPYHAAMAVAYGLPRDAALRALTLGCAEILGVEDRIGSLEVGKDATLIVTDGDPLEITTLVHRAWLQGRELDLIDRHKRFYGKYTGRPRPADLPATRLTPAPGMP